MKMKFNKFETALAKVLPRTALRRFQNRLALEQGLRAYEAVELSRLRKKREDARSPDQINRISIEKLRMQARYLDENHDVAKSVLNTLVAHVVGAGIMTFPMVRLNDGKLADETNEAIQMLWDSWAKVPEVTGDYCWAKAQSIAARSWFRDGEMFAQQVMGDVSGLEHGSQVMFSLELFEADYCPVGLHDDKRNVVQGVEKNVWGRAIAYWFYKHFPTELGTPFNTVTVTPIAAILHADFNSFDRFEAERMVHLKFVERIRQTRGVSIFSSVYQRLDDLKDYEESERVAARIGAAFALAITKSIDVPSGTPTTASWREMDIAPGIIADNLQPGEKIEQIKSERPSNNLDAFRTSQLRSIAGGSNTGFSSISKQYDGTYSAQRQELMEQNNIYHMIRKEFVSRFVDPPYINFVRVAIAQGLVPLLGVDMVTVFDVEHVGRGIPYIEPKREVEADEKKVQSGFASRSQIILERGGNPQVVRKQIVQERNKDEEDSLGFSSTAGSAGGVVVESGGGGNVQDDVNADEETSNTESADCYVIGRKYEDDDGLVYEFTKDGFRPISFESSDVA